MNSDLAIESFGALAVTLMVVFYALEQRGRMYIALFALACLLSAIYALLLGSYPFVIAETIWAVIAFRRFQAVSRSGDML
jgi:hypothetical protein